MGGQWDCVATLNNHFSKIKKYCAFPLAVRERSDRKRQRNTQFLDLLFLLSLLCTINKGVYANFTPVILYGGTRFVRLWVYMMGKMAVFFFFSCFSCPPPPAGGWVEGGGGLLSLRFRFPCFCGTSSARGTMARDAKACFKRKAYYAGRHKMPFFFCLAGSCFGCRRFLLRGLQRSEAELQPAKAKIDIIPASLCSAGSCFGSRCPLLCGLQRSEAELQPAIVRGRGFPASLCSAGSCFGSKG